jgi:hypothetical protein
MAEKKKPFVHTTHPAALAAGEDEAGDIVSRKYALLLFPACSGRGVIVFFPNGLHI